MENGKVGKRWLTEKVGFDVMERLNTPPPPLLFFMGADDMVRRRYPSFRDVIEKWSLGDSMRP